MNLLNELFGRFDKHAQENDCTRIKILGDCYYCVSGIPLSTPRHATNCVEMGLEMIKVIQEVRHQTGSDVDMRIGIHTGFVLSGVIGLKKWQYDVWSNDASIANYLESSGVPGKIHISQATLTELEADNSHYRMQKSADDTKHPYIAQKGITTYLITPDSDTDTLSLNGATGSVKSRRGSKQPWRRKDATGAGDAFKSISMFLAQCGIAPKPFARSSQDKTTADRLLGESLSQMLTTMSVFSHPFSKSSFSCYAASTSTRSTALSDTELCGRAGLYSNVKRELANWRYRDPYFLCTVIFQCVLYVTLVLAGLTACLVSLEQVSVDSDGFVLCVYSVAVVLAYVIIACVTLAGVNLKKRHK